MVAHDGHRVGATLVLLGVTLATYAQASVPSFSGGAIPMWFLTPPALTMFAALAVRNEIPGVGWSAARLRRARLAWALAILAVAGASAALVGAASGQSQLPELTVALTALTVGVAVPAGRGSAAVGAACLVVVVMSTHALRNLAPAHLWERLSTPGQGALALAGAVCVGVYAYLGPRGTRAALTG
jgi:hypothetical protein